MTFETGSLVRARGREWVVQPESDGDMLILRPLGGAGDETTGIYLPLERVEPAVLSPPAPSEPGDPHSARLLRDAVRLGVRSASGPFRSFGRLSFDPRPYQLVPLLMATKLETVRLLIADDVGVGKTVEAGMIARELIDQGDIERIAVLCPPHLAEQWRSELAEKFGIHAELVLPGTTGRLERKLKLDQSLFEMYPHVIVSIDYIKAPLKRNDFIRHCPELLIVDEAHGCAADPTGRTRQQRHELVQALASDPERHVVLVTATPHSGKEEAFRSLLGLLKPEFTDLPEDLSGKQNQARRRELAKHFVQRTRADIRGYMDTETPFPERSDEESTYRLTREYRQLFERVLSYAREVVRDPQSHGHRRRIRWWAVLGLLRALGSSPAAAAATLRSRAAVGDAQSEEEADEIGRRTVFDLTDGVTADFSDTVPGADPEEGDESRRRLMDLARTAEKLQGDGDAKLKGLVNLLEGLLRDGHRPIVFCRFIATAEYLRDQLRKRLPKDVEVEAVTGLLANDEREARVAALVDTDRPSRVLVATDCLSEGINLQHGFDAVVHYDLAWNPTRHEQRAGRVDRFGQPSPLVKIVTYYGTDNQIDGIILRVLIRKHEAIRHSLGISVPLPTEAETVMEAIFEGLLLNEDAGVESPRLPGFEEYFAPKEAELDVKWNTAADRERRSRTLFAQQSIKVDEVAREVHEVREALGSIEDVKTFVTDVLRAEGTLISANGRVEANLSDAPYALREVLGAGRFRASFSLPAAPGEVSLTRNHPVVEGLASYVTAAALDPTSRAIASRTGACESSEIDLPTFLVLLRMRFHIIRRKGSSTRQLLAEESRMVGFRGGIADPKWLAEDEVARISAVRSVRAVTSDLARSLLQPAINALSVLEPYFADEIERRRQELLAAHCRVRTESGAKGVTYSADAYRPPDVLGVYAYLPAEA
jgi:superfamily II DNA or RNA helicase